MYIVNTQPLHRLWFLWSGLEQLKQNNVLLPLSLDTIPLSPSPTHCAVLIT